jgi:hypothetical protein
MLDKILKPQKAILIVFSERDLAAAAAEKQLRGMLVKTASVI